MAKHLLSPIYPTMKRESRRVWISGLLVTLTTIVAYLAFWHLAPIPTFVVGCVALIGMLFASWWFGRKANEHQEK